MYTKREQCSETVFAERGFNDRCQKIAKVKRNGTPYCTIHDPEYIKEKRRKWQEKFAREWEDRQWGYDRTDAMVKACLGLDTATLKALNPHLIAQSPRMHKALKHICDRLYGIAGNDKEVSSTLYALLKSLYTEGYEVIHSI